MDYNEQIKRTWNSDASIESQVEHCALGIKSEVGEYLSAIKKVVGYGRELDITNVKEELGDLFYFTLTIKRVLRFTPEIPSLKPTELIVTNTKRMQHIADEIYDKIKIAYNYWTHKYESDGIMENTINNIFRDINELCYIHGLNPEEVRAANIRKLQVRFPHKFDMGEATKRNLDAERNAITNKED